MPVHNIDPVYDEYSEVLILGSFPSVRSRETGFFYGHPQNRFWKVTAAVMGCPVPRTVEEKKGFLLGNRLALWDVLKSCAIRGSSDASITDAVPNDLSPLLEGSRIKRIFCNGSASYALYEKYLLPRTGIRAEKLPSTSPANAAWSLERLTDAWKVLRRDPDGRQI